MTNRAREAFSRISTLAGDEAMARSSLRDAMRSRFYGAAARAEKDLLRAQERLEREGLAAARVIVEELGGMEEVG